MAENEDGIEKSEEPTEKKKSKAREEGQIARSKELTIFLTLIASVAGMYLVAGRMLETLKVTFSINYTPSRTEIFDPNTLILHFRDSLSDAIWAILPFLLFLAIAGVVASIMLGGFNITAKPLQPKLSKLSPLKGLKRMFGTQGLIELLKSVLKISLLGFIATIVLMSYFDMLFVLSDMEFIESFKTILELLAIQFFVVSLGMTIVAIIDIAYQLYTNKEKLKMTKQEVKDENKNTEGNPEVKGRQRAIQRQVAMQRMMADVPSADVVITNPTHYAVALKYDQEKGGAPIVIAKGVDLIAQKIIQVAKGNEVTVVEIPPLSRSIYHHAEIGDEIPAGLYVSVARVLAYIFQLRSGEIYHTTKFDPSLIDIPEELRR